MHSRQAPQFSGFVQDAFGLTFGPACTRQPAQPQLGPHPHREANASMPCPPMDPFQGGNGRGMLLVAAEGYWNPPAKGVTPVGEAGDCKTGEGMVAPRSKPALGPAP